MANEEHLEILRQGVEVWNRWREENPNIRPDLRGADLGGAHLFGADLREADLRGADLIKADLSGADLRGANLILAILILADLRGADLRGADLFFADLFFADLRGADLRGADLRKADLDGADLDGADLGGVDLFFADLGGADLRGADLDGEDLDGEDLGGAHVDGTRVPGHDLLYPPVDGPSFYMEEFIPDLRETAVDFTVFYPMTIFPERWYKLLAYVHLPSAFEFVLADSHTQLGTQARNFATGCDRAAQLIKQGAEIVIVPKLPVCRFNPPRTSLLWLEDWHRAEFRMQAEPDLPGFELDMPITGRVAFYVGPILIGEVRITAYISRDAQHTDPERPNAHETAKSYQSVFVSYSHKDTAIVDRLERAYTVLGMEYFRDVRILRSGEKWNPALLGKIEEADIFQLCWSYAAKESDYVEQEWRHAVSLDRPYFIRPVYWEKPMPAPPAELGDIHFAYLELEYEDRAA
jgi:hypothetical protein